MAGGLLEGEDGGRRSQGSNEGPVPDGLQGKNRRSCLRTDLQLICEETNGKRRGAWWSKEKGKIA